MNYIFTIEIEGINEDEGFIGDNTLGKILVELEEVIAKRGYYLYDSCVEEN